MQDPSESDSSGLRRRAVGQEPSNPNLALNDMEFEFSEGVIKRGPSPSSTTKVYLDDNAKPTSMSEFRKKQQSFEIHIEDCDEEELSGESDEEEASRPITPAPPTLLQNDFGNVVYKESTLNEFLQVGARDMEGLTDVSEGESENDDEDDEVELPPNSVIKRTPS